MLKMMLSLSFLTFLCIVPNAVQGTVLANPTVAPTAAPTSALTKESQPVCQGTRRIGTLPVKGGVMTVTDAASAYFQTGGECFCMPVLGGDIYLSCTPSKWPLGTDVNSLILSCAPPGSTTC